VKHTAALWPAPMSSRPSSSPALPLSSFNATSYPPQCSPLSPSPSTPSVPPTDKLTANTNGDVRRHCWGQW
jgi:hypothetical protein